MTKTQIQEIAKDRAFKLNLTHEDIETVGCGCPLCGETTTGAWWIETSELGMQITCEACAIDRNQDHEFADEMTWTRVDTRAQRTDRESGIGIN